MNRLKILKCTELNAKHKQAVLELWNKEYPKQLAYQHADSFDQYLAQLKSPVHYLLAGNDGDTQGWAFTFDRDGERWFAIIVDSTYQRMGLGSALLDAIKRDTKVINGWVTGHNEYLKTDGSTYNSPLAFYLKNGFTVVPNERLETDTLSAIKIIYP